MSALTPFDVYEIHPVTEHRAPDGGTFCAIADNPAEASFWSLCRRARSRVAGGGRRVSAFFPASWPHRRDARA
jgi:hypothetical protein